MTTKRVKLTTQEELIRARRRERQAQAALAQLRLDLAEGRYVEPVDVEALYVRVEASLRRELAVMVDEVAQASPGYAEQKDIEYLIRRAARAALERMGAAIPPPKET